MATIKHSGLIDQLKGKLHGSVFQSGPGGNVIRGGKMYCRTAMYNRNNATYITPQVSSMWKTLAQSDRDTWQAQVGNYPTTDKFGNPRTPSAYTLFMKVNACLANIGLTELATAIAPIAFTDFTGLTFGLGPTSFLEVVLPVLPTTQEVLMYELTPAFTQGRNMPVGYWRFLKKAARPAGTHITLGTQWEGAFGSPLSGLKVYCRVSVINRFSGQKSAPYILSYVFP